jgi:hypothetical protein
MALLTLLGAAGPVLAEVALDEKGKFKVLGDFVLRGEADWDSQDPNGVEREDRNRARVRVRLGLTYDHADWLTFGVRMRTGIEENQRSPFTTIVESDNGKSDETNVFVDKWYAVVKKGGGWGWAGRQSFPFWKQNELLLDDDITAAGVAGGWNFTTGKNQVNLIAAYLSLPDGSVSLLGNLAAGQAVYSYNRERWGITGVGGLFAFYGEEGAKFLTNGNGARDYTLWAGGLQGRLKVGRWPLALGVEAMHNAEEYSPQDLDPYTVEHRDEKDAWVVTASAGQLKAKGDWLFAYYRARIQTLGVNAAYTQDDWTRWGTGSQPDTTDMSGHELRGGYAFSPQISVLARLYLAEAITTVQDGKRFRVDIRYEF